MALAADAYAVHRSQAGASSHGMSRTRALSYLGGGALGNVATITPAVHAVFGTFLIPVTQEFGWPRATFSLVLMIIAASAALIYPLSGYIADRVGGRPVLVVGYALFAASLIALASLDGSVAWLYACFLLVGVCGAVPSTALLSKLVSERFQGQATALAVTAGAGNAIGCIVMPVMAAAVLSTYGWRSAYVAIGVVVLVLGLVSVALLGGAREGTARPERTAERDSIKPVFANPVFWLLLYTVGFGAGGTTVIFSHIVPIVAERGIGLAQATGVVSLFSLVSLTAQILSGRLLDRLPSPRVAIGFYLCGGLGLALVEYGHGLPAIIAGASLLGLASGMQFAALPYLVGRYFGFRHFGLLVSLMYSAVVIAQGVLPVALDATFDASGSYRGAIVVACMAYVVGAAALCFLPSYARHALRRGFVS